ncbi:MAG: DUF935 family protein, partial [Halothiobacillus sp.]|nr:DUF935 family protein [Halothiobacillus sp.]
PVLMRPAAPSNATPANLQAAASVDHTTGCQCDGCTGVAALAASSGQPDTIQPALQIAARLSAEAQPVMADWLAQIEVMLESASSLDEFKAMLLAAFDQLDTDKMGAVMSDAIIAASAAGRFDVAQTGDNQSGNNQA